MVDGAVARGGDQPAGRVGRLAAVFTKFGGFGTPGTVTAGFKPALWACSVFALLAALSATAMSRRPKQAKKATDVEKVEAAIGA